mgnify:CR=1 FL=1|tara:strand:+ start:2489 stop:3139 length:651 start_codon:yes stop_codon:yes gene_type:complete
MDSPNYYAIIPAEVRYSDINPSAKLLYGELTALSHKEGYCFASNNYFSELYGVSKNTISLWIKALNEIGFVNIEMKYKNKQIIERRIYLNKLNGGITKKNERGIIKKVEDNITSINITSSINNRKLLFEELVFQVDDVSNDIKKEFLNYWTEPNQSKTKMRFELERTWDLNRRLKRWVSNSKNWNKSPQNSKVKQSLNSHQKAKEMIRQMNNNTNN